MGHISTSISYEEMERWKQRKQMEADMEKSEYVSLLKQKREVIRKLVESLRGEDGKASSRSVALALTKLEEASLWLREAVDELETSS